MPAFVNDPSFTVFYLATLTFSFGVTQIYQYRDFDKYRLHFLIAGILVGSSLGLLAEDTLDQALRAVPATLQLVLMISIAYHDSHPSLQELEPSLEDIHDEVAFARDHKV